MLEELKIDLTLENITIDSRCCEIMGNGINVCELDSIDFGKLLDDFQV